MKAFVILIFCGLFSTASIFSQPNGIIMQTPFEQNNEHTATYDEIVSFYKSLSLYSSLVKTFEFGMTDIGDPLQEVIIDREGLTNPRDIRAKGRAIVMINNGIHPGEPCGIDASMMMARDLVASDTYASILESISFVIVPVYNIGGCINRNGYSRPNQSGPESYGFRGNARNFDLNRDFVKCDSKNAQSFNQLFTKWSPDILIDNHTSNGADYQYTMTLIATQEDKISPSLGGYMREQLVPALYKNMAADRFKMIPYVDMVGKTPEKGIVSFVDSGRYSSGYAALHHTIAFMPETHMLKPFKDRVWSTYDFMKHTFAIIKAQKTELLQARKEAFEYYNSCKEVPLQWKMDMSKSTPIEFDGYEAGYKASEVSGLDRLYYDRSKPYTKTIPFYDTAKSTRSVKRPKAYIIPSGYAAIIDRLRMNQVEMTVLESEASFDVEMYYIEDYKTTKRPYEGHYLHSDVEIRTVQMQRKYRKGDVIVYLNQAANRYIIETLEPQGDDSFFNWNFMDAILQQKEYFSSYIFEDLAAQYLREDPELKAALEAKRQADPAFAKDGYAQLKFVYKRSPHYEKTHNLYPIARLNN